MLLRTLITATALTASAFAATVTGVVTNKTTNKPANGADVVALSVAEGLKEAARTKTDGKGNFTLNIAGEDRMPHLIQVEYQGANYPKFAPPGTESVAIDVYDVAKKVDGITGTGNFVEFQTLNDKEIEVIEAYVVRNESKPPRTQLSDKSFEIYLPEGAKVENSVAGRVNGMPVNNAPVPQGEKGRYAFIYPLRPGETLFRLAYKLPYNGKLSFTPHLTLPMDNFVVMMPTSMHLEAKSSGFANAPDENGMHVAVVKSVQPTDRVAFEVSGTGQIPQPTNDGQAGAPADNAGDTATNKPGGGIGQPIRTPDPLEKYKWWIFGGVTLVLIAGAGYVMGRPATLTATAGPVDRRALLLEALKEELFRLESDKAAGKISESEYAEAKSALDLVLKRAMSGEAPSKVSASTTV
jgi:hypothetical protein